MRVDFYTMSYIIPLVASVAASPLRGFTQTALLARAANLAFLDSASCTFSSLTASTSSHQIDRRSHASITSSSTLASSRSPPSATSRLWEAAVTAPIPPCCRGRRSGGCGLRT